MNDRGFLAVCLLLIGFGILILATCYLFGKTEYLVIIAVAEVLILLNLFLWKWLFSSSFFQKLLTKPLLLFCFYSLKFLLILLIFYAVYNYLKF